MILNEKNEKVSNYLNEGSDRRTNWIRNERSNGMDTKQFFYLTINNMEKYKLFFKQREDKVS